MTVGDIVLRLALCYKLQKRHNSCELIDSPLKFDKTLVLLFVTSAGPT